MPLLPISCPNEITRSAQIYRQFHTHTFPLLPPLSLQFISPDEKPGSCGPSGVLLQVLGLLLLGTQGGSRLLQGCCCEFRGLLLPLVGGTIRSAEAMLAGPSVRLLWAHGGLLLHGGSASAVVFVCMCVSVSVCVFRECVCVYVCVCVCVVSVCWCVLESWPSLWQC
jgi:hypothetical protein